MNELSEIATAFVEMAHRIVWCSAATVDAKKRPRSRILHPLWLWDGKELMGWIATGPTPIKRAHLEVSPYLSLSYWSPTHDTCVADCHATWFFDDETRTKVWNLFKNAPKPVGYDPAMIPVWKRPTDDTFAALRLDPWQLRVFPGTVLAAGTGKVLTWKRS
jgi:hypothetical protein